MPSRTEQESAAVVVSPAVSKAEKHPEAELTPGPVSVDLQELVVEDDLLVEDVSIDGMCGVY